MKFEEEILEEIKNKKELKTLDIDFVSRKLSDFFKDRSNYQYKEEILEKISKSKNYKQFSKSKEHDFLIKNVRSELRKVYGAFILEMQNKREKYLKNPGEESSKALLMMHKSTAERMDHVEELYAYILSKLDGKSVQKIKKKYIIMDLACGHNPITCIYYTDRIEKYIASDISSEDCEFLSKYLDKIGMKNECFAMDLAEEKNYGHLHKKKADVCYIFKTLDGLERVRRNITEKLLKAIDSKFIVVTFPTLSLGGVREIKEFRRSWFEKLLDKMEWKWEKKMFGNELVYFLERP